MTNETPPHLSETDFMLIGEVIVHAAALEQMLTVLASVVVWNDGLASGREPDEVRDRVQSNVLGEMVGVLLSVCRAHESVLHDSFDAQYLRDLWEDCSDLAERRNALAHSFWEKQPGGVIVAKRALPKWKREPGVDFVAVGGSLEELAELRDQFADAIRDIKEILDTAWPDDWPEVARFTLRPPSLGRTRRPRAPDPGS